MSNTEDELAQVREIEATQDRLAGAVESLAYKKSHLKQEAIGAAQVQADRLLEKAEQKKDEVVAALVEKLPSPHEIRDTGQRLVTEVAESTARRVANVKEAAASELLAEEGGS